MNGRRQEGNERAKIKKDRARKIAQEAEPLNNNRKHVTTLVVPANGIMEHEYGHSTILEQGCVQWHAEESDSASLDREGSETTDSETIP